LNRRQGAVGIANNRELIESLLKVVKSEASNLCLTLNYNQMKEDEVAGEEQVLNLGEQFCWDMMGKIDHCFLKMLTKIEDEFQLCDDKARLDAIYCRRKKLRVKLLENNYHDSFPIDIINTHLKQHLKLFYNSILISNALFLEYDNSIKYGKFQFNSKTRTLTVCPSLHYQDRSEDFSFATLDKFHPLIKYILRIKMLLYLNEQADNIYNKQKAEQHIQEMYGYNVNDGTENSKNLQAKTNKTGIPKVSAFTYLGHNQALVFMILKRLGAISEDETLEHFNNLFDGLDNFTPFVWHKEQGDLKDFFQSAISTGKLIYPPQQHWNIVEKCFIKPDGSHFNVKSLKVSQSTTQFEKFINAGNKF